MEGYPGGDMGVTLGIMCGGVCLQLGGYSHNSMQSNTAINAMQNSIQFNAIQPSAKTAMHVRHSHNSMQSDTAINAMRCDRLKYTAANAL